MKSSQYDINSEAPFPPSLPVMAVLSEKKRETPRIVSLFFEYPSESSLSFSPRDNIPGQFVMVWMPGINEKPFVISYLSKEGFAITVMVRGDFSRKLSELNPGDKVGFRGPFGRGFSQIDRYPPEKTAILGGGCGMAPLALLAQQLPAATLIQGGACADDLLFLDRFPRQIIFTEDGSAGIKGLPTEWLEGSRGREYDVVYSCGPETMMKTALEISLANRISFQGALERYMKCGTGVCGQCECDGQLICRDGPVFSDKELALMPSFGSARRDATGKRIAVG